MSRNGKIGFKSYDRFFPNQDTMPEGGLGNKNTINHRKRTFQILEKCYYYTIIDLEKCNKTKVFTLEKCVLFAFYACI